MKVLQYILFFLAIIALLNAILLLWGGALLVKSAAVDLLLFIIFLVLSMPVAVASFGKKEQRLLHGASGALVWSCAILYFYPRLFSVDRQAALESSFAACQLPQPWAHVSHRVFPLSYSGKMEKKEMIAPSLPSVVVRENLDEDSVALPFEWEGASIKVPLTVVLATGKEEELWMIFDTGATLSTINKKALLSLGEAIPSRAPRLKFKTANGITRERLAIISDVWIGGYEVGRISVAVCESCSGDQVAGLLGMNVTENFIATVDTEKKELILKPRKTKLGKEKDIRHWIDFSGEITGKRAQFVMSNRAPVAIRDIYIQFVCMGDDRFYVGEIEAEKTITKEFSLSASQLCEDYRIQLVDAQW